MDVSYMVEDRCPKCGTGRMHGPRYCNDSLCLVSSEGREHLHYTCGTCGYESTAPTADAKQEGL